MTRPSLVLVHSPVLGPSSVQPAARALSGLAAIAAHEGRVVAGSALVDARLPNPAGATPMAEPAMVDHLRTLAVDGLVPRWSRWWGEEAFDALVTDAATAERMRAEMRPLPLVFFGSEVPVPPGWPDTPCAYLQLSPAYDGEAAEARARGWPVARVDGTHLDPATRPDATAAALDAILARLP